MVKNKLFLFFVCCIFYSFSENANLILIEFKDKGNYSRDIDVPVNLSYIDSIRQFNINFVNASKWMNTAIFKYYDVAVIDSIKKFPFVQNITFGCVMETDNMRIRQSTDKFSLEKESETFSVTTINDNNSFYLPQLTQIKGDFIQNKDYKGRGIKIAVIDNGFPKADEIEGLQHIFSENRIKGTYDYYNNTTNVYFNSSSNHGTNCFSIIGGKLSNYTGSAPDADFYLYRTEVDALEGQTEEILMSKALEDAVDAGINIVNISLGYNNGFNDGTENHTYNDLDGKSTIAAKAVNIAASKGILVCVSAGNEGNSDWKYISTPADADSAFTVGSVDANGIITGFSSTNLPDNTSIKPNVMALGSNIAYLNSNNTISVGNGTSYSAPIIAGLSACLWQAFPDKNNWEIKTAIEQSSNKYENPDKQYGYGIPDFEIAYKKLFQTIYQVKNQIDIFPNPTSNQINIYLKDAYLKKIILTDNFGKRILEKEFDTNNQLQHTTFDIANLPNAVYYLHIITDTFTQTKKILKQ